MERHIENERDCGITRFDGILNLYVKKDCRNISENKHKAAAQRMPNGTKDTWGNEPLFKQDDLYVIPEQLIYDIFTSLLSAT